MVSRTSGSPVAESASAPSTMQVHYRYKQAGDVNVFYREAGDAAWFRGLIIYVS